jgi:hypothetical protein
MKTILAGISLALFLVSSVFAAGKGPEIQVVDGKVSIQADSITLTRFLHLLDQATGMTSKVAPELANQKISVRLEGLDIDTAIRKSFQGQPWNYAVVPGKGINVIDRAQAVTASTGATSAPVQTYNNDFRNDNPPLPVPSAAPFQPATVTPAAAASPTPNNPTPSAGTLNLPPVQGGNPSTPPPVFQPLGTPLGTTLPGAPATR